VENHQQGYPRLSAITASQPSFSIIRRFLIVRMRLLLYKQDEICVLEEELNRIDREEPCELFLGNRRRDTNQQRKEVMKNLEEKLAEYDEQMQRYRTVMGFEKPKPRDVTSLRNWIDGNASIARKETQFLSHSQDLMGCLGTQDAGVEFIEPLIEDFMIGFNRFLGRKPPQRLSRDENVHIFCKTSVQAWSKSLIVWIAVSLLLVPLGVLYCISNMAVRFMVILLAMAAFILTMSFFGRANTSDLLIAGSW
ncbi:hypothetical protein K440DRAFT_667571, partial [Wilcoxina mikolae CBS 423.85]